jgi:two-component system response regulator RegX3
LLAKVKAVLKRHKSQTTDDKIFSYKNLRIDFETRGVVVGGVKVELKAMEYKLLVYLVKNSNRVITRDDLFKYVWEDAIVEDNTLNVHVRRLRTVIEHDPNRPSYIKTHRGVGYVFEVENV